MSSGRVSVQAYKGGIGVAWRGHFLSLNRHKSAWVFLGLIDRYVLASFISVRRLNQKFAGPLGVKPKYFSPVWRPVNAARVSAYGAASALGFSALYVSNWARLPKRGRFLRALVAESNLRLLVPRIALPAFGVRGWFSQKQELVFAKVRPVRFFVFQLSRLCRQLRAQGYLSELLGLPARVSLLSISSGWARRPVLWSAFHLLQARSRRYYGRRFAFLILSLGAALFWQDLVLVVQVFAAGIRRTHYHYSAIKHLARVATSFLCWNLTLKLLVLQFMGRFNRRDRTGRFDVASGFGSLGRSSATLLTYAAYGSVRTHRGVFGLRAWAR